MIISICGTDGAGKSTQIKKIKRNMNPYFSDIKVIDKWQILDASLFPECDFIKTDLPSLRVNISHMEGYSRLLFLYWSIYITMNKYNLKDENVLYILDGYWMKHAASEIIYGADENIVQNITSIFPKTDLTFYIQTSINTTAKRKENDFTPYECGRDDDMQIDNFISHQKKLKSLLDKWSNKYNWICINGEDTPEDIEKNISSQLLNFKELEN